MLKKFHIIGLSKMETISGTEWSLDPAGSKYIVELDLDKWEHGLYHCVNAFHACKLSSAFKKKKKEIEAVDGHHPYC